MSRKLLVAAVMIPLLGIVGLIVRAESAVRSGASWLVRIEGYDPRDLISGHYLRFRYVWRWDGVDSCGERMGEMSETVQRDCCLCLTREDDGGEDPAVQNVSCDRARACDGWLLGSEVAGGHKYFVPEERATELERALREREAALRFTCGPGGSPAIQDLYLDGRPWRERLR